MNKPADIAIKLTTPFGIASYPKLNSPDEYKGKKQYKVKLILDGNDPKVQEFADKVRMKSEEFHQIKMAEAKPKPGKPKPKFDVYQPIQVEYAADGETPTGRLILQAKMNASYTDKQGVEVELRPAIFDSLNQAVDTAKIIIRGGSEMRLSVKLIPFANEASNVAGGTFQLQQVQVRKFAQGGGGGQSAFDAVDGDDSSQFGSDDSEAPAPASSGDDEF